MTRGSGPDGPLWAGRFASGPAPEAHALGRSLGFDIRLAEVDVRASVAHVQSLRDAGLLRSDDASLLGDALVAVGNEIAGGDIRFDAADEDIHSAIERAVIERLGDLGARLHAGRSRNDLVVTDLRLWLLAAGRRIDGLATMLARTLIARAREHITTVMPGTTHMRPAQPVTLSHHLLAHAWPLIRDLQRFDGWADRTSTSPLGAGAIATSTLPLDPGVTAERLGFARAFPNSIDAVSDRDFVQEFLADAAICATHLSRLAADLARWSDPSVGWAELDEGYSTGSSMMPQKRNPDTAELSRAKAARIAAGFVGLTTVLRGCRSATTATSRRTRSPRSTRPTRWSWCWRRWWGRSTRCDSIPTPCAPRRRRRRSTRRISRRRWFAMECRSATPIDAWEQR